MSYESTSLLVDDREPDADKFVNKFKRGKLNSKKERLPLADFQWTVRDTNDGTSTTVLVERKTTTDLLNSIRDGRLGRFIDHEPSPTEIRILLHERITRKMEYSGFKINDNGVDNILLEAQMRGVYVVQCQTGDVANRIISIWNWTMRPQHRSIVKPKLSSVSKGYLTGQENIDRKAAVRFLMGIPGLGEVRTIQILSQFRNPAAFLRATLAKQYDVFRDAPGISKARVDAILEFLERDI